MELDIKSIEESAARQAADHVIDEGKLYELVRTEMKARIDAYFISSASDQMKATIDAAVKAGFDHAYTKVDSYGRAVGEPTTILKEIERAAKDYWTERVDSKGEPSTSSYSAVPRALWFMTQIVAKDFTETMKQQITNTTAALKDGLRVELRKHVDEILGGLFRVQSLADKEEKRSL